MGQRHDRLGPVCVAVVALLAWTGVASAADPSPGVSVVPATSAAPSAWGVPSTSAATPPGEPIDDITWKVAPKGLGKMRVVTDVAVRPDGRIVAVGFETNKQGYPLQAVAWAGDVATKLKELKGGGPDQSLASAVAVHGDGFLIAGSAAGQSLILGLDGKKLTTKPAPGGGYLNDIDIVGDVMDLTGSDGSRPTLWSSADGGATWTATTLGERGTGSGLAHDASGREVVVGTLATPDGVPTAWTVDGTTVGQTAITAASGQWYAADVVHGPDGFVTSLGNSTTPGSLTGSLWLSQDGTAWSQVLDTGSAGIPALAMDGDTYLAVGTGTWWSSPDGVTWTTHEAPMFDGWGMSGLAVTPAGDLVATGYHYGPKGPSSTAWSGTVTRAIEAPTASGEPTTSGPPASAAP